jgi:hypothetical protein
MDELMELREYIEQGRYADALVLIGEMEEMSRDDKINKFGSFVRILLIHLIKQHAEARSSRSWDLSIRNAMHEIAKSNKQRGAGSFYLSPEELREIIEEEYQISLENASYEAFGGAFETAALALKVDEVVIQEEAFGRILEAQERLV